MARFKLESDKVPSHLKPGSATLRVPILRTPEFPWGCVQINVAPSFEKALLRVAILGIQKPERVEIARADINEPARNLQVEITREEATDLTCQRIFREPIAALALLRTPSGWEAEAEDMVVEDEDGLEQFATLVMGKLPTNNSTQNIFVRNSPNPTCKYSAY